MSSQAKVHSYHYCRNEDGCEKESQEDGIVVRPDPIAGYPSRRESKSDGNVGGGEAYCCSGN